MKREPSGCPQLQSPTLLTLFKRNLLLKHSHDLSETTYRDWFRGFKNNDFDVEDEKCTGTPKKFKDKELEALLHEDLCQEQGELAESLGVNHNSFEMFESIWNDSIARTLGAV